MWSVSSLSCRPPSCRCCSLHSSHPTTAAHRTSRCSALSRPRWMQRTPLCFAQPPGVASGSPSHLVSPILLLRLCSSLSVARVASARPLSALHAIALLRLRPRSLPSPSHSTELSPSRDTSTAQPQPQPEQRQANSYPHSVATPAARCTAAVRMSCTPPSSRCCPYSSWRPSAEAPVGPTHTTTHQRTTPHKVAVSFCPRCCALMPCVVSVVRVQCEWWRWWCCVSGVGWSAVPLRCAVGGGRSTGSHCQLRPARLPPHQHVRQHTAAHTHTQQPHHARRCSTQPPHRTRSEQHRRSHTTRDNSRWRGPAAAPTPLHSAPPAASCSQPDAALHATHTHTHCRCAGAHAWHGHAVQERESGAQTVQRQVAGATML